MVKHAGGNVLRGHVFRIERKGTDYFVQPVTNVAVYPCEGCGRNPASEAALAAAITGVIESRTEGWRRVMRLYRGAKVPEERCWLRAPGWTLAFE
jgi:protein-L-isoaspartate(D-aspartate) O-methyltransferase